MQSEVARIVREHQELDRLAGQLQADILTGPPAAHAVFAGLAAYASTLSEHLLGEHEVLETAQRSERACVDNAGQMRGELDALRWDWEEYLSVWTEETAAKDWQPFSEHSLAILDRIRRRIARENEMLGA